MRSAASSREERRGGHAQRRRMARDRGRIAREPRELRDAARDGDQERAQDIQREAEVNEKWSDELAARDRCGYLRQGLSSSLSCAPFWRFRPRFDRLRRPRRGVAGERLGAVEEKRYAAESRHWRVSLGVDAQHRVGPTCCRSGTRGRPRAADDLPRRRPNARPRASTARPSGEKVDHA